MPSDKNKKMVDPAAYKTEEELKQEARRRMEELRLMEAARRPKSERAKKADNFWYHYRVHVLAGAAVLAILAFFVRDVLMNEKSDFLIITASKDYLSYDAGGALTQELSSLVPDVNRDGKNMVELDIMQIARDSLSERFRDPMPEQSEESNALQFAGSLEADYAVVMKLAALLASNSDPIFLLDEAAYDYLTRRTTEYDEAGNPVEQPEGEREAYEIFYPMPGFGGPNEYAIPFSSLGLAQDSPYAEAFSGMSFYLRNWEGDKKNGALFEQAKAFLLGLAANP